MVSLSCSKLLTSMTRFCSCAPSIRTQEAVIRFDNEFAKIVRIVLIRIRRFNAQQHIPTPLILPRTVKHIRFTEFPTLQRAPKEGPVPLPRGPIPFPRTKPGQKTKPPFLRINTESDAAKKSYWPSTVGTGGSKRYTLALSTRDSDSEDTSPSSPRLTSDPLAAPARPRWTVSEGSWGMASPLS
ncbi:hypothetical protein FA13DRAFT_495953 [Coprinellus micaceus]|uniref:Uncharacterized protein n=1 Tax=Coprinellus micaceus TaxID=71717 RepID=A0A4Y7T9E2_COPMI|nr:hypothetical protein FA13DRAFT_495953 [Coprinellus micaceus]